MFELYNQMIDEVISQMKSNITELADVSGEPRVVKHDRAERVVIGDFFAIVSAGPMEILGFASTRITDHTFSILVDLNYYSDDFKKGQEENLKVSGKIYDLFHNTNLNEKCRHVEVEFFPVPSGTIENFYAMTTRVVVKCERGVQR